MSGGLGAPFIYADKKNIRYIEISAKKKIIIFFSSMLLNEKKIIDGDDSFYYISPLPIWGMGFLIIFQ